MSLSNTSLPKPKNWQDFENNTRVLFACVLSYPNTQQNGRSGQNQSGVDVYGYRDTDRLVGVQCKKKYEKEVTSKELHAEVNKAKTFKPKLSEFILITTAARDQKIQESARLITAELARTDHQMHVSVWGWEDVEEHASKYDKAWKAFDPTWNPFAEQVLEKVQEIAQSIDLIQKGMRSPSSAPDLRLNESDENTPRHGQITTLQGLIDEGYVNAALPQLIKLKDNEWTIASRSERYRILVGIASAKLKLGDQKQAGSQLLDAYNECPEHKNADRNRAAGFLLTGNYKKAAELARAMLAVDRSNASAAGILIQSRIEDSTCEDALNDVPMELHESEDVLIAHIQFLWRRDNPAWTGLAKSAAEKYPDNRMLKLFSADAVLDELVRTDRDAIAGGILHSMATAEFDSAVEILYLHARDAIDKGYALIPSTAHNAALAIRFSSDHSRAKEILDASIKQYPDDEKLRLQRAVIALEENDRSGALNVLPNKPTNPEVIGILAEVLAASGKQDDAIALINDTDETDMPKHVKAAFLAVRVRVYIARGEKQLAIDEIKRRISAEPENLTLRVLLIHTFSSVGDDANAEIAFKEALSLISDQTELPSRLALSFEARQLGHFKIIIDLLKDRVATDRESEGLHTLIAASINSGHWVSARSILSAISPNLRGRDWFLKADAILAINTGDQTADEKIERYLRDYPNDVRMILVRIGVWQRNGRDGDIRHLLQRIVFANLMGKPDERIHVAALMTHYGETERGLEYAYSVLMNNWEIPEVHLAYQGLILLNENIGAVMPSSDVVAENTVVCLRADDGERRYRIEKEVYGAFGDERIAPESDLATALLSKQPGDKIKLQEHIASKLVELIWIKPVYIDAFHCSLEQFNERFPRANGLQKIKFDINAPDPLEDVRAVTKARAEADQRILAEYQSKNIPLSFAAALIGKDPLDAWSALPSVDIQFQVCRGTHPEREEARQTILNNNRKGCVVDAITLSVVRRLGVEKAVSEVCGPIHTTQAVMDLLLSRALEAKRNIGKKQGFMAWREDRLVFQEYTEDILKNVSDECEKEIAWAQSVVKIASTMPKKDLSPEVRKAIDVVGNIVCDPAIAADGNELLLLSEDMGFRIWSAATFEISTTWLQPVLIAARDQGFLTVDEYCKAINMLALGGHTYISLDPNCLIQQARKDNYEMTKDLAALIRTVGGPSADLRTNTGVLSNFMDMVLQECFIDIKVRRIASEAFYSITRARQEDQRQLILVMLNQIRTNKSIMTENTLGWLIGHSMGMPYFNELLQMEKDNRSAIGQDHPHTS